MYKKVTFQIHIENDNVSFLYFLPGHLNVQFLFIQNLMLKSVKEIREVSVFPLKEIIITIKRNIYFHLIPAKRTVCLQLMKIYEDCAQSE